MQVIPNGQVLGARVEGVDLARPLDDATFRAILQALGRHGVLCFPRQQLTPAQQRDFSRRLGVIQYSVTGKFQEKEVPEVGILSNIVENGAPIGIADAGQDWHTDMSYSKDVALANVLHAMKVPVREGRALGETQFRSMHVAYEDLPADMKRRLAGRTATHDFAKFWDMMRLRPGSKRGELTPEQRASKPPVSQPIFQTHPITGRTILYCNPGYAIRIDGMEQRESDEILDFLFTHQEQEKYFYAHAWSEGDVLMWDNIGTVHNAVPDYRADEPRYMRRVQVMATKDYGRLAA